MPGGTATRWTAPAPATSPASNSPWPHDSELASRIYLASKDGYQDSVLPTGGFAGTPRTPWTAPATSTSPVLTSDPTPQRLTTQPAPTINPRRTSGGDH